jgi:DNA-binding response OmpR family regulator
MTKSEKPYVLLVDDNEATSTLVTALLLREFEVETAGDSAEAIESLKTRQYAAVLLDLRIPNGGWSAVLDFLEEHSPETMKTVLILTSSLRSQDLVLARKYAICGVLTKPFEVESFLAAVKQCARLGDGGRLGNVLATGGPVILLLTEVLKRQLM